MSTVRTPQNRVNDNEDVNLDKTRRATSFEMMPETPLGDIEDLTCLRSMLFHRLSLRM